MIKSYIQITKPGIVYSNVFTACAGFFLGSSMGIDYISMIIFLLGVALVIGSSTVLNNIYDKDIDEYMPRTKKRLAIVESINEKHLYVYLIVLFIVGNLCVYYSSNFLTLCVVNLGYFVYIVLYTMLLKRTSIHSTLVGSISGGVPPLAGYTAAFGAIDTKGFVLFLILCAWQMIHFYAIAIFRMEDYKKANVMVLTVKNGIFHTKIHIFLWSVVFSILIYMLYYYHKVNFLILSLELLLALGFFLISIFGFSKKYDSVKWARFLFFYSILVIVILCILIISS